ncbi:MAG: arsenite methyltransferase [Chloroflexi bacterium]|nr:arsenite methyltransferase [Chloroflexota bacterium]MCL5076064.1 arsenite methyltransferase [Chloroflexota bacterium]
MSRTYNDIKKVVKEHYTKAAQRSKSTSCCAETGNKSVRLGYSPQELSTLPATAISASLGCGNPLAWAELKAREVVLDLGSGGGIDVLLAAQQVGPEGKAIGLDMTDDMLALAQENQRRTGLTNVEFIKGEMEAIPLPDASVDVILSNCVINLSPDKDAALREAFRVLRPSGRLAVSDVVALSELPEELRRNPEAWCRCIAGALTTTEYVQKLRVVGFTDIDFQYASFSAEEGCAGATVTSAFIKARKP